MKNSDQMITLKISLDAWKLGQISALELTAQFRDFYRHLGLPDKYGRVLEEILGRIESSSLFTEESCSFSQKDLVDALNFWIEKAQAQAQTQAQN
jgi:hypothetical protein